jgi:pimeloyl-ACP methyl ester carboxylesterase
VLSLSLGNTAVVSAPSPWPGRAVPAHVALGRQVEVDGALTYVRETPAATPAAEPAVYVHGLGGSSGNWVDLAPLLAHRLAGQAIDLPGFGCSEPARRYSLGAFARRVARWIEHSDRGPVHLIGNSLGGAVAVLVAANRPDLVRTLVLVSPAMPFLDPRRTAQWRMLPLICLPYADRLARRMMEPIPPEELARQILRECFGDPAAIPQDRIVEAVEELKMRYVVPWFPTAYVGTLRGLVAGFLRAYLPGSGSLWRAARAVRAPTLVVTGTSDRLIDVRVPARVARTIRGARLVTLPGVGHVPQLEAPGATARAILELLDEVAVAAATAAAMTVGRGTPGRGTPSAGAVGAGAVGAGAVGAGVVGAGVVGAGAAGAGALAAPTTGPGTIGAATVGASQPAALGAAQLAVTPGDLCTGARRAAR